MFKHERKIKRKNRNRIKRQQCKSRFMKHLDKPITNRFVRFTTYFLCAEVLIWIPFLFIELAWVYFEFIKPIMKQ